MASKHIQETENLRAMNEVTPALAPRPLLKGALDVSPRRVPPDVLEPPVVIRGKSKDGIKRIL